MDLLDGTNSEKRMTYVMVEVIQVSYKRLLALIVCTPPFSFESSFALSMHFSNLLLLFL